MKVVVVAVCALAATVSVTAAASPTYDGKTLYDDFHYPSEEEVEAAMLKSTLPTATSVTCVSDPALPCESPARVAVCGVAGPLCRVALFSVVIVLVYANLALHGGPCSALLLSFRVTGS
jgi:hypothetical protein